MQFAESRIIAVAMMFTLLATIAHASDGPRERATLKGLRSVRVVLEKIAPEVERDGLTSAAVETDVEVRLRQSAITVDSEAGAMLYVNVNAVKSGSMYAYSAQVTLEQRVVVVRTAESAIAVTWSTGTTGIVGTSNFPRSPREPIRDLVNEFINAYLSVNPKR